MDELMLRKAHIRDLSTVLRWEEEPHVIASDVPDGDWNWREELQNDPPWREQLIAEVEGRAIGFVQIIDPATEETHYWGDIDEGYRAIDIWIGEKDFLRKGYGTQMMQLALEMCFASPEVKAVLIDPLESNTGAIQFYKTLGFEFLEKRRFEDSDCAVLKLTRPLWESRKNSYKG